MSQTPQTLTEKLKSFMKFGTGPVDTTTSVERERVIQDLEDKDIATTVTSGAFFDDEERFHNLWNETDKESLLHKQNDKIRTYRELASTPDVSGALEEIINEITFFNPDDREQVLKIDIENESETIVQAITTEFEAISRKFNFKSNMYNIVRTGYIDGQLILHHPYSEKQPKSGIKNIKLIDPIDFYYDTQKQCYRYNLNSGNSSGFGMNRLPINRTEYQPEEISIMNFGLSSNEGINLSYLEYAIKTANNLKNLEDMLVILRRSRSISRRVFNVDIGDLPNKKAKEALQEIQRSFKYKKLYNTKDGTIINQNHITAMMEDYWFANRSGGRGTQVDVLDETGNLGEINDILYFNRKLYKSMHVPASRLQGDPDADHNMDFDSTDISREDMSFFAFVSRIRTIYTTLFKNVLKKHCINKGVLTETDWESMEDGINISFTSENIFLEKMKLRNFSEKLEIYGTVADYQGKLFPVTHVLRTVFNYSDEQIEKFMKDIQKEKKNKLFEDFYKEDENF